MGTEVLPLREADVRDAANELLDAGVEGICICLLFGYRNAEHEIRVAEIVEEVKSERGLGGGAEDGADPVPIFVASELYPLRRDLPRLNSTLVEAYAAEPSRGMMQKVRDETKGAGAGFELRVMASHGGTISIEAKELATTLVSGPIGGVVGGQALAEPHGASERPLHRHRRDLVRHRPDHGRALRDHPDARHRPLRAQHAVGEDRLDRRRHGLVRARQPELEPPRARPRLGRLANRRQLAGGRPRHGLDHRPQRRPRPRQPGLLPRRRHHPRPRARPGRGRAPGRRTARARGRRGGRRGDRAVRADASQRGDRADSRQGLLARRLRAALLRRRRAPARRRLHRGGRLPRRPRSRLGGGLLGLRLRLRGVRVPIRPDGRHADPADRRRDGEGRDRVHGQRRLAGTRGAGRGRVREVGNRARRDPLQPLGADAVLRPAQRHRDRLPALRDGRGRAPRRSDRRLRGRVLEGLRALGTLARARLPDHPGDRPRLGRGREAGPATARGDRGRAPGRLDPDGALARRRRRDVDHPPRATSAPATRSPVRRSSSTRRRRSRSRRVVRRGSTATRSSTSGSMAPESGGPEGGRFSASRWAVPKRGSRG